MDSTSNSPPDGNTDDAARTRWSIVWPIIHLILYVPFAIWFRIRVIGRENLQADRGGIMLINHQSFLDPLFVAIRLSRPVSYLARDSLFKVPFIGWVCRTTYVIPISRTAFRGGSIRTALDRLRDGFLVGIYPEGTRSSGAPKEFRPGFLSLVRRTDAPIYPVAISGADKAMPKGAWFIRPAKITVVYGEPLSENEVRRLQETSDDKKLAAMIRDKVSALYEIAQQR